MTQQDLRFRNGFLFSTSAEVKPAAPAHWRTLAFSGGVLQHHPETQVTIRTDSDRTLLLVGECFDPEAAIYDADGMATKLLQSLKDEDVFLDALDDLAGRFALLVMHNGIWRVFHDAMGSRSVFYHRDRAIVASHVELIATPLCLRYADYFIPFLTSKNYQEKDVKFLPGNWTPYESIRQLTPNTFVSTASMTVQRYWPRDPLVCNRDVDTAARELTSHLSGLSKFLLSRSSTVLLGLTGGTDSRGLYAALRKHDPNLFTWIRSRDGSVGSSADYKVASAIAAVYGHQISLWKLATPRLNDTGDDISIVFREVTASYRGSTSSWLKHVLKLNPDYHAGVFVRGFGGEILRGFYQESERRLKRASVASLANAYDINAGSKITRQAFSDFIDECDFREEAFFGRDPNDMFYWEHRMGAWGSIAMSEADIAVRSLSGYNSRRLFDGFFGLDYADRRARSATAASVESLAPEIANISIC